MTRRQLVVGASWAYQAEAPSRRRGKRADLERLVMMAGWEPAITGAKGQRRAMLRCRGIVWALLIAWGLTGCAMLNRYQDTGRLTLSGLERPIRVVRDEKGMPYIYAESLPDAFRGMGFATAQDRLFQMELTRMLAAGRIAELAGPRALPLDRRMRTIGIFRLARRHAQQLKKGAGSLLRCYVEGVNAFVEDYPGDHHLEFKLAGIRPEAWSLVDVLSVMYYMSWTTSANIQTEIITQMLVDRLGIEKAQTLFPLNINPDDTGDLGAVETSCADPLASVNLLGDATLMGYLQAAPSGLGSNNWAAGPALSPGGRPIVANDPHLDARLLPGPLYPCGLITPELRIVGAHIPGLPVMPIFRNEAVAVGITNAYADVQDLYLESIDPTDDERYLEGRRSVPFEVIQETLRYRDDQAAEGFGQETLTIRLTHRGPVISDVFPGLETEHVLALRWAAAEVRDPTIDVTTTMQATSARELRETLRHWNRIQLNFVYADGAGNIGWQVSGSVPRREGGCGTVPWVVRDGRDNWHGWIPFEAMPHDGNPAKGWLGTCNHKTVNADYPFYYSSYFASSYRYQRLKALMASRKPIRVADHWRFQRDTHNLMAETLVPAMARHLSAHQETRAMGDILSAWDCQDSADQVAPTLFHAIHHHWALQVFQDELGETLARTMLGTWYFWQERFQHIVLKGQSDWFDDAGTPDVREGMAEMLLRAAREARRDLAARLGDDMRSWRWGRVHTIAFVNPIRREGLGKDLLGAGVHPMGGSGETLRRGRYDFNQPFEVTYSAALRMVADLNDPDKVLAVIPGGVSGRLFHSHAKDQLSAFLEGENRYWWFSDTAIAAHARSKLILDP